MGNSHSQINNSMVNHNKGALDISVVSGKISNSFFPSDLLMIDNKNNMSMNDIVL